MCVVYLISLSILTVIKLRHTAVVTCAGYSISMKSIFAPTVKGSLGVVANSIIATVVCCAGTLVYI